MAQIMACHFHDVLLPKSTSHVSKDAVRQTLAQGKKYGRQISEGRRIIHASLNIVGGAQDGDQNKRKKKEEVPPHLPGRLQMGDDEEEEEGESEEGWPLSRSQALRELDRQLGSGNEREALAIASVLQGKPRGLRGFGGASQVPLRIYTLEELRLNKIETTCLLSPVDTTLGTVKRNLQLAALAGGIAAWQTLELDQYQLLSIFVGFTFLAGIDLVLYGGGIEALVIDTLGRLFSTKYRDRVAKHEAGHFLVAYLVGILPKSFTLSSLDALKKEGSLNVQAGTAFVDLEFQEEVKSGKLSSSTLNKYTCIALAGVATEYLLYGLAEGGLSDIQQLDNLLKGLNFTQKKADSQIRWAVLNTITLLRRHMQVHSELAMAMNIGKSIGECIEVIESGFESVTDI